MLGSSGLWLVKHSLKNVGMFPEELWHSARTTVFVPFARTCCHVWLLFPKVSAAFAAKSQGTLVDVLSVGQCAAFLLRQVCILAEGKHVALSDHYHSNNGCLESQAKVIAMSPAQCGRQRDGFLPKGWTKCVTSLGNWFSDFRVLVKYIYSVTRFRSTKFSSVPSKPIHVADPRKASASWSSGSFHAIPFLVQQECAKAIDGGSGPPAPTCRTWTFLFGGMTRAFIYFKLWQCRVCILIVIWVVLSSSILCNIMQHIAIEYFFVYILSIALYRILLFSHIVEAYYIYICIHIDT